MAVEMIQIGDQVAVYVADRYTEIGIVRKIRGPLFLVNGKWFSRERIELIKKHDQPLQHDTVVD